MKSRANGEIYPGIFALLPFRDKEVKKLVCAMKFDNDPEATRLCAELLHIGIERLKQSGLLSGGRLYIMPIPSSRLRRWQKGFNQCENLAETLRRDFGYSVNKNILSKPWHSGIRQQKRLDRNERLKSQRAGFLARIPAGMPAEEIFLLVDDVTTTGATLSAAISTLKGEGLKAMGMALGH